MKDAQSPVVPEVIVSGHRQYNPSNFFIGTENPCRLRFIQALRRGSCTRADIDEVAGASNGPEVIAQLRRLGLEIPCERIQTMDRDGLSVRTGRYRLTDQDRKKLRIWFASTRKTIRTLKGAKNGKPNT
jgi:hypothetical protein